MAVEIDVATVTAIISNINSLYGNLVSYTVGLILFVGVFVPAVISFFQSKQFTREYEELSKKMHSELREKISEAENNLRITITEAQKTELDKLKIASEEMKKELIKAMGVIKAHAYHVQANQNIDMPTLCLCSCEEALLLYIEGNDERNARSILGIISDSILKLNNDDFLDDPDLDNFASKIINTLTTFNENGRYAIDKAKIESNLRAAKKRSRLAE